jgi:hypothetical protein
VPDDGALARAAGWPHAISNVPGWNAADLDDFPSGSAFVGAYELGGGRFLASPNGDTAPLFSERASPPIPREQGHLVVSDQLEDVTGTPSHTHAGFTAFVEPDRSLSVEFKSRGLNYDYYGDILPTHMRPPIVDALGDATGRPIRPR